MKIEPPERVSRALSMLRRAGFRAVPVGGCVRDLLRGEPPHDWDIATAARPDEMKRIFAGERILETGLRHGTLTLLIGREPVEITSFRADGDYSDGRRPDEVRFTRSLEEDLSRRDFTINALCLGEDGAVIDLFGGREDLARGVIRCIGDPNRRFREDALRILRALRFSARFGFAIEEKTATALRRNLPRLKLLAAERVVSELEGLLCAPDPVRVLLGYPEAVCAVFPALAGCVGLAQPERYHCYDVYEHAVRASGAVSPEFPLRLAALLHDVGKPACADGQGHFYGHDREGARLCREALAALRCSAALQQRVTRLVRLHHLPLSPERVRLRRLLARYGEAVLRDLLMMQRADAAAQAPALREERARELDRFESALNALLAERPAMSLKQLAVRGGDLLALGLPEGEQIGRTLRFLLHEVVEERLPNDREALLSAARERTGRKRDE